MRFLSGVPCRCCLTVSLLVLLLSAAALAQSGERPIAVGQSFRLASALLQEEREVMVSLPQGYEQSANRYPVVYLLDGETHFEHVSGTLRFLATMGRIPQTILVGIPNTNRNRDLLPMHVEQYPGSGGADRFLDFMQKELFPSIDSRYRTLASKVLIGHSYGGVLTLYAMMSRPGMVRTYLAIGPGEPSRGPSDSVGGRMLPAMAEKLSPGDARSGGTLVVYAAEHDAERNIAYASGIAATLKKKAGPDFSVRYDLMPRETHGSMVLKAVYNGLEELYAGLQMPPEVADGGAEAVHRYFKAQSQKLGFEGTVREEWLNMAGYQLLFMQRIAQAVEVFALNVRLNPESANVYDSLGEAYERAGDRKQAQASYEQACVRGEKTRHPALEIFKANLARVLQQEEARR